jgi:hypothetical protein
MAVHDDWQGKGVGAALMEAALDLADNWLNLTQVELNVYTDNAAGAAFSGRELGDLRRSFARGLAPASRMASSLPAQSRRTMEEPGSAPAILAILSRASVRSAEPARDGR